MAKVSTTAPASTVSTAAPATGSSGSSGGLTIAASAGYTGEPAHEEGAAYSTEDIVSLLAPKDEPDQVEEGGEGEGNALPADDTGEGVADAGAEGKDAPDVDYPMPEGWEEAMWKGAAPELRGKVDSMVKAHAEAIAAKEKAMQEAAAQHREQAIKAHTELQTSLGIVRRLVEGEFAGIDWNGLRKTDPELYVQLDEARNQRLGAIQQMEQMAAAKNAQLEQARAAEAKQALQAEFAAVLPKVQALVGAGFEGKAFGRDLVAYLQKSGVPMEAIGSMSKGYEMELAAKAMLYDRGMEARKAAAAKVAEAPRVQEPHGADPADSAGARLKSARANLHKNPNSTEALAALFAAM